MHFKDLFFVFMALALAAQTLAVDSNTEEQPENSTDTIIADLALIDSEIKTSTEKPTNVAASVQNTTMAIKSEQPQPQNTQPQTVADFIIHPLIAFKPRTTESDLVGKQAGDSSSTTPSPWSLFGFNTGQGLGSSVSSLAGSVSGWLTDRIQLPGLVDTPIRESTTTTTSTSTTTTERPDVVVRVQHRPTTRRPLIAINNKNRPQRFQNNNNFNYVSEEYDDEDLDDQWEEDEDEDVIPNKNKRKNMKKKNNRRKPAQEEEEEFSEEDEVEERPIRPTQKKRRPVVEEEVSEEVEEDTDDGNDNEDDENVEYEESDENDDDEEDSARGQNTHQDSSNDRPQRRRLTTAKQRKQQPVEEDAANEHFYYGGQSSRPSTKRSQKETTFFQLGQDSILNQLRQLTRGRTPAEVGALVRKSPKKAGSKQKRRQQATLLVNRNGQTFYLAPELLNADLPLANPQVQYVKKDALKFPQPPLTAPVKRKNAPMQYITIPWSQLGIAPPNRLHSITEGIQSQPLILNIPASAIETMQNQSFKRKKQPVLTAEAVPLLAEASIMDIFQPPKMPHDRESTGAINQKPIAASTPIITGSKKKPSTNTNTLTTAILPQRIRPATIVEKAPASAESQQQETSEEASEPETNRNLGSKYILVGEDSEPGLTRQVEPVYGEARYVNGASGSPYVGFLKNGRLALHRSGREHELPEAVKPDEKQRQQVNGEQLIPVEIISEPEEPSKPKVESAAAQTKPQPEQQSEPQAEVQKEALEGASVPASVSVEEKKPEEPVTVA